MNTFGLALPDYPWEAMAPYLAKAAEHPGGVVNLSIGTPVDPTPALIQDALGQGAEQLVGGAADGVRAFRRYGRADGRG